jgi:hypothetical protein
VSAQPSTPISPRESAETLLGIQHAFNRLLRTCDDVYMRRSDQAMRRAGSPAEIEVPDPFTFGGVDGLILWGYHNIIKQLDRDIEQVMVAVNELHEAQTAFDAERGIRTPIGTYPSWLLEWRRRHDLPDTDE